MPTSVRTAVALCLLWVQLAGADHYTTLGLSSKSASAQEIKRAYRKLSLKYHPDKTKGDDEAQRRFMEISKAYETLSDQDRRSKYDLYGEDADKKQANNIFGNGQQRGQDMQAKIPVSLAELYSGGRRDVSIQRQEICSACRGTGAHGHETKHCHHCNGQGKVVQLQQMGFMQIQTQAQCTHCHGTGRMAAHACHTCGGARVLTKPKHFRIEIERGMKNGEHIRFEREANQQPGVTPGAVVFVLEEQPHETFVRAGRDLETNLTVSLLEALVGFHKTIRHLDGHMVTVSASTVSTHGQVITLAGEGMPDHDVPSQKGVLRVSLVVKFPETLSNYHKRELKNLL